MANLLRHYPLNGDGRETVHGYDAINYTANRVGFYTGSATEIVSTHSVRLPNDAFANLNKCAFTFFFRINSRNSDINTAFSVCTSNVNGINNFFFFSIAGSTKRESLSSDLCIWLSGTEYGQNWGKQWDVVLGRDYFCTIFKDGGSWKFKIEEMDRTVVYEKTVGLPDITFPVADYIVIGQEQDGPGGGFGTAQCLDGVIADFRVWDDEPTEAQINKIFEFKYCHIQFENSLQDCSGYGNHITMKAGTEAYNFNTEENKVGKSCLEGIRKSGSEFGYFPEYMTAFYPYFTVCFYVKNDAPYNWERIFDFGDSLTLKDDIYSIAFNDSQVLSHMVWTGSVWEKDDIGTLTGIKHIAVTRDDISGEHIAYINGEVVRTWTKTNTPTHVRRYGRFFHAYDYSSGGTGNSIVDDFRMYGSVLSQDKIKSIISERFFIDKEGNLYCYKKAVVQDGKGFYKNGYVEFDGFHEDDVDGTDNKLMRQKQGNVLGVNKIFEGY